MVNPTTGTLPDDEDTRQMLREYWEVVVSRGVERQRPAEEEEPPRICELRLQSAALLSSGSASIWLGSVLSLYGTGSSRSV